MVVVVVDKVEFTVLLQALATVWECEREHNKQEYFSADGIRVLEDVTLLRVILVLSVLLIWPSFDEVQYLYILLLKKKNTLFCHILLPLCERETISDSILRRWNKGLRGRKTSVGYPGTYRVINLTPFWWKAIKTKW